MLGKLIKGIQQTCKAQKELKEVFSMFWGRWGFPWLGFGFPWFGFRRWWWW
jgi:hypothetical protein